MFLSLFKYLWILLNRFWRFTLIYTIYWNLFEILRFVFIGMVKVSIISTLAFVNMKVLVLYLFLCVYVCVCGCVSVGFCGCVYYVYCFRYEYITRFTKHDTILQFITTILNNQIQGLQYKINSWCFITKIMLSIIV